MRFRKFAVLLPLVLLAACATPQVAPTTREIPPGAGYARGIDMATDSSDVIAELQGRPWLRFVARYYRDPASRWPALTADEARRLSGLGLQIVAVWEWHSGDPAYFTYTTGYRDALSAVRQAKTVGQPPGSAIYFAVDFNAKGAALYQVDQYFRGVNNGLAAAGAGRPEYRIGVYGSGAVCAAVKGAGLAQYAWLSGSTSWDGTADYGGWNIRQASQGAHFANLSFDHDANDARAEYGGFQIGNYAGTETPAAAIVRTAAVAPAATATAVSRALAAVAPPPSPLPPTPAVAAAVPAVPPIPPLPAVAKAAPPAPSVPSPLAIAKVAPPSPPIPSPLAIAKAAPTRATSVEAAEVAALAAAEPAVDPPAVSHAAAEPRSVAAHARPTMHAAKGPPTPKPKGHAVATHTHAAAIHTAALSHAAALSHHSPGRHSLGEPRHQPERKTSTARRTEAHPAHRQAKGNGAVHALERPARHHTVEEKPPHRGKG